jgi:hypothetical protein
VCGGGGGEEEAAQRLYTTRIQQRRVVQCRGGWGWVRICMCCSVACTNTARPPQHQHQLAGYGAGAVMVEAQFDRRKKGMTATHISGGSSGSAAPAAFTMATCPLAGAFACRCKRSFTCNTVRTAVRTPTWHNQCVVGVQPRVAALISLVVIEHVYIRCIFPWQFGGWCGGSFTCQRKLRPRLCVWIHPPLPEQGGERGVEPAPSSHSERRPLQGRGHD